MAEINLTVGIFAIVLSILTIILSIKWNLDAKNNLNSANKALEETKNNLTKIDTKTENIEKSIDEKLNTLIDRAAPSAEDKAMEKFFGQAFQDPEIFKELVKMGMQQETKKNHSND